MKFKYFSINNSGASVRCKIYFNDLHGVKRVVIYGHGFGGHKDNKAAENFADYVLKKYKDISVLTYNAPCHGDDVRKALTLDDCNLYIKIVSGYAKEKLKAREIYSYATSFGGYLILKYIAENESPFKKIALRCPAVNMYEVLAGSIVEPAALKALARNKSALVGFDRKIKINKQFLESLKVADIFKNDYKEYAENILIVQGTKDEVVSFGKVEEFADKNSIRFVPVEGADHRFQGQSIMNKAIKEIVSFFEF